MNPSINNLKAAYDNNEFFYWTNGCGEINMPGDGDTMTCHPYDELPLSAKEIYDTYCTGLYGTPCYVVSCKGRFGFAFSFLLRNSRPRQKKMENFLDWFVSNVPHGVEVYYGAHTDPEAPEIVAFIPKDRCEELLDSETTSRLEYFWEKYKQMSA